ncbi:TIR domain-containing protein [Povalibacter sp.]|uniref:TIR domain-containing protein n=1 Tax=Povalibacter sp. TaxID=1962978 RepID=UPI002F3EE795
MTAIFISYRRADSGGQAGRLFDHLGTHFGEDNVFMDVDDIDLGRDFKPVLREAVRKCDIMLVVIGPEWLEATDPSTGQRRLDNPGDWVRAEIVEALQRNIAVVPVLVRGAPLPAAARLPEDIRELTDRQAISLSDTQWRTGVTDLVARLKAVPLRQERDLLAQRIAKVGPRRIALAATAIIGAIALVAWRLWPGAIEVPSIVGLPLTDAEAAIAMAGLERSAISEQDSLTVAPGQVISQDPSPGSQVTTRQPVKLIVARMPPPVDLSNFAHIRDTGPEGTIAALAAVTAMEVAFAQSGSLVQLSERYLYQKAKHHDEAASAEGTWMTTTIYVAEQFGVARLSLWPYRTKERPADITWDELDTSAAGHKASFHRLAGIDQIYPSLRAGRPVLASVSMTGKEWDTPRAARQGVIEVTPSPDRRQDGTGAIAIVGFNPAAGMFRFANCWGDSWGDKGFGTMSVDTARTIIDARNMWAVEALAASD